MDFLKNIGAKMAINLLRKKLSKELNKKVENFKIVFIAKTGNMQIEIDKEKIPFNEPTLQKFLNEKLKDYLPLGCVIDAGYLNVNEKIELKIFYTIENKKEFKIITL
jgi:hypothetical protein